MLKKLGQIVGSGLAALSLIGVMAFLVSLADRLVKALLSGGGH